MSAALMTYDDGTPRTRHVTTNVLIEIDDSGMAARSQSYYTVLQSLPDFPLQPIATGTYRDRFEKRDGCWTFVERSVQTRFAGDTSRHRRPAPWRQRFMAGSDGREVVVDARAGHDDCRRKGNAAREPRDVPGV